MTSSISCSACQHVLGIDESRALEKGQLSECPACGAPMQPGQPTGTDDTGAFQRFYSGGGEPRTSLVQRFVAWWREHVRGVTAR
jgi:NAD-dependent SIR2 family protein deacetylase